MAEPSVINASPLIFLSRSVYLALLQEFSPEIWVPDAVASEILRRGRDDISARAISKLPGYPSGPQSMFHPR